MTKYGHRAAFVALGLVGLCTPAASQAEDAFVRLKGADIRARFTGMTFTDEVHWTFVFERGGQIKSMSMGKRGQGTWGVKKNELCMVGGPGVGGPGEEGCYEVWKAGSRIELRREGSIPEEGILQKPEQPSGGKITYTR
jgi:hypothetical protein